MPIRSGWRSGWRSGCRSGVRSGPPPPRGGQTRAQVGFRRSCSARDKVVVSRGVRCGVRSVARSGARSGVRSGPDPPRLGKSRAQSVFPMPRSARDNLVLLRERIVSVPVGRCPVASGVASGVVSGVASGVALRNEHPPVERSPARLGFPAEEPSPDMRGRLIDPGRNRRSTGGALRPSAIDGLMHDPANPAVRRCGDDAGLPLPADLDR